MNPIFTVTLLSCDILYKQSTLLKYIFHSISNLSINFIDMNAILEAD